jgi:hypothetical protein
MAGVGTPLFWSIPGEDVSVSSDPGSNPTSDEATNCGDKDRQGGTRIEDGPSQLGGM